MRASFFIIVFWAFTVSAQGNACEESFHQNYDDFLKQIDNPSLISGAVLTISELQKALQRDDFEKSDEDFFISSTPAERDGFFLGVWPPTGDIVALPGNFIPGVLTLEVRGEEKEIFLSYVVRDENGGYSIFFLDMPQLKGKIRNGKAVRIRVLMR